MSNRTSFAEQNEIHVRDLEEPMEQHRSNGNCMWYAINEACGGDGNMVPELKQGSGINALNLKRLTYEKLFAKLKAKCRNLEPVNFDQDAAVIYSIIEDGSSGPMANGKSYDLNEAQFDLQDGRLGETLSYLENNEIKDVSDITYDQLKAIMAKLSKAPAEARDNVEIFKYIADCPKDGHPFADVECAHPLRKLCDKLLTILQNSEWLAQRPVEHYALLNATRHIIWNDENVHSNTAPAIFFAKNLDKSKEVCEMYNNDPSREGNPIMLNFDGMPMPQIKNIIDSMFEIAQAERYPNSYTSSNTLPLISQILGRDVLLIDATVYGNEEDSATVYSSKICAFELYEANGTMTRYAINEKTCKIAADGTISFNLDRNEQLPVLKKDSIVIAAIPAHYCAPKSFAEEGLSLKCLNEQGEMEEISITNLAQLGLKIQGSSQEVQPPAKEAPREIPNTSSRKKESSWSNLFSKLSNSSGLLLTVMVGAVVFYIVGLKGVIMYLVINVALNFSDWLNFN